MTQATANRPVASYLLLRLSTLSALVLGDHCDCPAVGTTERGDFVVAHRACCPVPAGGVS